MATRRLTVDEALDAVFDDDFGLSDGESSEEEGDDLYALLGEPVVRRSDIDALTRDLVDDDDGSTNDDDNDGDSDDGDRASDGFGDVLSVSDPKDPLGSDMVDGDVGRSSPSSTLGAGDSFAATSREDDEGEISDEAPMEFDESPELSEGESENEMNESDDCGGESDDSSESCSSGDEYRSPGRGRVRARGRGASSVLARGRGASSSVRARGRGSTRARGRGTIPSIRARGRGAGGRTRGRGRGAGH